MAKILRCYNFWLVAPNLLGQRPVNIAVEASVKLRLLAAGAALGISGLFGAGGASALPLSSCVPDLSGFETCSLYESDPNGSPSEVSSVANPFDDWNPGYFKIFDPNSLIAPVLSDVVVVTSDGATLYSFDDGGVAPVGFPGFDSIGSLLGSATEDVTGFATFGEGFDGQGCCDIINVYSPSEATPEPITISIFGAGLVGAVAMRRRKKKAA